MPVFKFDKLVRDKMPQIYERFNQTIRSRLLDKNELRRALREKLIEEAQEIPVVDGSREDTIAELADVEQLMDDLKKLLDVTSEEIAVVKMGKLAEKGGFSEGIFVESIEMSDDDKWVEYYRKEPLKYPEIGESGKVDPELPELEPGIYRHAKSGQLYEVLGVTFNTETYEPLVVYRPLYDHGKYNMFARPYYVFTEMVELEGEMKLRFEKVIE